MTRVINIHSGIKYDVYIGRAGKGHSGQFGNLHPIGYCNICKVRHDRAEAIAAYKKDFYQRIDKDEDFRQNVLELKDKTLGCFCKLPHKEVSCHGDVLKEYLDNLV